MPKKAAAKRVAAKKVASTRVTEDDLIGDNKTPTPAKKVATKHAAPAKKVEVTEEEPETTGRVIGGVVIPPYPPELATIEAGDKTPAVKRWYKDNHPQAYTALYGNPVG
jgi:transposase